jgi:hypothetical protein
MKRKYRAYKERIKQVRSLNKRCPMCNSRLNKCSFNGYLGTSVTGNFVYIDGAHFVYACKSSGCYFHFRFSDEDDSGSYPKLTLVSFGFGTNTGVIRIDKAYKDRNNKFKFNSAISDVEFESKDVGFYCDLYKKYKQNECLM